ncbi:MAG: isochorismate synthase [Actinomycetota bacterium]
MTLVKGAEVTADHEPRPLIVRSTSITDPGPLLDLLPDRPAMSWVRHGEGIVGWGVTTQWASSTTENEQSRFLAADHWWRRLVHNAVITDHVHSPGSGLVAFGSFTFDEHSTDSNVVIVPEIIVGHRQGQWWVTTVSHADTLPGPVRLGQLPAPRAPGVTRFYDGALPPEKWSATVAHLVQRIIAGEVDKIVLARDVEARTEHPIDPRWVLQRLADQYPSCWAFAVDGFLGATPELLVRRDRGLVHSRVLAGTIRRTGDDARDLALSASLARSSKDLEEHEYAVRSLADALAPHCTSINVPEAPFVLHLPNVMHLVTDIAGALRDDISTLGLVAALHPTAAVGGTPTATAVALIRETEGMDRGRYSGPVGWIDGNFDGEWGIALRCARQDPADQHRLRLFAGCGIVAGSIPADEVAESEAKLAPVRDALTFSTQAHPRTA